MTLGLDTLDADKIVGIVNRAASELLPYVYLLQLEFVIIGQDEKDAIQVADVLRPRVLSEIYVKPMGARKADSPSNFRGMSRISVLLLDHVRLGTVTIIEMESSLAYTRRCCNDVGWAISEDDLIFNMQGERFYRRKKP